MTFPKLSINPRAQVIGSALAVVALSQLPMSQLSAPFDAPATKVAQNTIPRAPATVAQTAVAADMATVAQTAKADMVTQEAIAAPTAAPMVSQNAIASEAAPSMPAIAQYDCPITLDLLADANAMIGISLLAPCLPDTDLLVVHAGLVFSAKTMASGALFISLPALTPNAKVAVRFSGGAEADGQINIPEAAAIRRFAVQWPETDGFDIHAYEGGAEFDDPGHIWQANLAAPLPGAQATSGYLTILGDKAAAMPMLAQVYTYPQDQAADLVVEARVTPDTCGFDLMGTSISSRGGALISTDITLAMPDCDAVGQFVQLPDLDADPKLALAN